MFDNLFFINLAKLFFAIASTDQKVKPEEIAFLKTNLKSQLKSLELFSDSDVNLIFNEFNSLTERNKGAHDCFEEFKAYYIENPQLFSQTLKTTIWETADGIAAAYAGKNKSEVILLAKLKELFLG
ncbi:MAG: hypothetical protein WDZ45_14705 [Flavobacteriaceae bacterium]